MKCLIVDDEPIAREILKAYCAHFPDLELVGSCSNALEAKRVLEAETIDILFLDINMPVLDGISFLKTLRSRPKVILTTAYKEYAADAFDLEVTDYLVKPFSLERFILALDKTRGSHPPVSPAAAPEEDPAVFLKSEGKIFPVRFKDIVYAEANGNYTLITTESLSLKSPITFTAFEALLPATGFERVHRSFIINKNKITHMEGNRVFLGKYEVPVGQNYRDAFLKSLGL